MGLFRRSHAVDHLENRIGVLEFVDDRFVYREIDDFGPSGTTEGTDRCGYDSIGI